MYLRFLDFCDSYSARERIAQQQPVRLSERPCARFPDWRAPIYNRRGGDTLRTEKQINFHEEFANTIGSAAPHQNSHRRRAMSSLLTVSTIDKDLADRARKAAYIGFGC